MDANVDNLKVNTMEYKVLAFVASLDQKRPSGEAAAEQLQAIINKMAKDGWEYVRVEGITTWIAPETGCFGFGGKPGYSTAKQMIVFQKIA
jgi:hypothetical protein